MTTNDVLAELEVMSRPTPDQIDALAAEYERAADEYAEKKSVLDAKKDYLTRLTAKWGRTPQKAASSKRLEGGVSVVTITYGTTIVVKPEPVSMLHEKLTEAKRAPLFDHLFEEEKKYSLRKNARLALKAAALPKRLGKIVFNLFAMCFDVDTKSPTLKVERIGEKKARGKKAQKAGE